MMKLRQAEERDWARLFAWRNDAATVAASVSQLEVSLKGHMEWLRGVLKTKDAATFFVAHDDSQGVAVGTIRLDITKGNRAVVSLTVDRAARGRGYAGQMIQQVEEHARAAGVTKMAASVRMENTDSLRAFASNGYLPVKYRESFVDLEKVL